jgi:hypothetical protein
MIINIYGSSFEVPVCYCHNILNFLERFSRNTQISNFMKIRPVVFESFHADGLTHMTTLIVALSNIANVPKNICLKAGQN